MDQVRRLPIGVAFGQETPLEGGAPVQGGISNTPLSPVKQETYSPVEGISTPELLAAGAGKTLTDYWTGGGLLAKRLFNLSRGLGTKLGLPIDPAKTAELEKQLAGEEEVGKARGARDEPLMRTIPGLVGSLLPELIATYPVGGGLLKGATTFGGLEAVKEPGTWEERAGAGLGGAAGTATGQLVGGALTKLGGAMLGKVRPEYREIKEILDFAKKEGVPVRIGDLGSSYARGLENLAERATPPSKKSFSAKQQEAVKGMLFPEGRNVLAEGIEKVDKAMSDASKNLWKPVDQAAKNAPWIKADNLRTSLRDAVESYPELMSKIPDKKLRDRLESLIYPTKGVIPKFGFEEFRDIQQGIGFVMRNLKEQAAAKQVPPDYARALSKVYASTKDDLANWGQLPKAQYPYSKYLEANEVYKKYHLPWELNDVVQGVKGGKYAQEHEKFLRDLMNPGNRTKVEILEDYLKKLPSGADTQKRIEVAKLVDRATKKLYKEPVEPGGYGSTLGLLASKTTFGAPQTTKFLGQKSFPLSLTMAPGYAKPIGPLSRVAGEGWLEHLGQEADR